METLQDYYDTIVDVEKREFLKGLIDWTLNEFPNLELMIKWNQPMFVDHGTFIIAYSTSKNHISIAPEKRILDRYLKAIKRSGYNHTKKLFHVPYVAEVDYNLLHKIIAESIEEKKDCDKFWLS